MRTPIASACEAPTLSADLQQDTGSPAIQWLAPDARDAETSTRPEHVQRSASLPWWETLQGLDLYLAYHLSSFGP